jgi:hypothetical protein
MFGHIRNAVIAISLCDRGLFHIGLAKIVLKSCRYWILLLLIYVGQHTLLGIVVGLMWGLGQDTLLGIVVGLCEASGNTLPGIAVAFGSGTPASYSKSY